MSAAPFLRRARVAQASPPADAADEKSHAAADAADERSAEAAGELYGLDLAAVAMLDQVEFGPVTVLAGANGSGKSTVVEALAVAAGFNPEGGSRNLQFNTHDTHSALHDHLTLEWSSWPRWGWFLRAETYYGMASHIANDDDPYGGVAALFPDLHGRSHGESFLALAESRFTGRGFYLFDEPESALSIQGQMTLAAIIAESVEAGSQFIIATHSPMLMAYPEATIYELDAETGIEPCRFDDLLSTTLWFRFFAKPESFYEKFTTPPADPSG
ncbi:MAG: AAA family ATPase [Acidimicrobiales bacterium]